MTEKNYTGWKTAGIGVACAIVGGLSGFGTSQLIEYSKYTKPQVRRQSYPGQPMIDLGGLEKNFGGMLSKMNRNIKKAKITCGGAIVAGSLGMIGYRVARRRRNSRK